MVTDHQTGSLVVRAGQASRLDGVKVFSATMAEHRARLGEAVTQWISANPTYKLLEFVVTQSSDAAYHCISIVVFYSRTVDRARVSRSRMIDATT